MQHQDLPISSTPSFSDLILDNAQTLYDASSYLFGGLLTPVNAVVAALFCLPLAIHAQQTRQFKTNEEALNRIEFINAFQDHLDREYVIEKILETDSSSWSLSLASANLIKELKSAAGLEEKWAALMDYLNAKSENGACLHNGKKTFNAILDLSEEAEFKLRSAVQADDAESIQKLIEANPNLLTQTDKHGLSIFHRALIQGKLNLLNAVHKNIDLNAAINSSNSKCKDKTPLYLAAEFGQAACVSRLLELGVTIKPPTVIHIAAQKGHLPVVKILLEYAPYLREEKTKTDETPLHLAASNGKLEIIQFLLFQKASFAYLDAKTKKGKTAAQLAYDYGFYEVEAWLLDYGAEDIDLAVFKNELKELTDIIYHSNWQALNYKFFSVPIPTIIEQIKVILQTENINANEQIDGLNAKQIHSLASNLKTLASTISYSTLKTEQQKNIYLIIKQFGRNTEENFRKFDGVREVLTDGAKLTELKIN